MVTIKNDHHHNHVLITMIFYGTKEKNSPLGIDLPMTLRFPWNGIDDHAQGKNPPS